MVCGGAVRGWNGLGVALGTAFFGTCLCFRMQAALWCRSFARQCGFSGCKVTRRSLQGSAGGLWRGLHGGRRGGSGWSVAARSGAGMAWGVALGDDVFRNMFVLPDAGGALVPGAFAGQCGFPGCKVMLRGLQESAGGLARGRGLHGGRRGGSGRSVGGAVRGARLRAVWSGARGRLEPQCFCQGGCPARVFGAHVRGGKLVPVAPLGGGRGVFAAAETGKGPGHKKFALSCKENPVFS